MDEPVAKSWKRTSVELPTSMIEQIEQLRREWGLRHRGAVLERLLLQIFEGDGDEPALPEDLESASRGVSEPEELDDQVALVLIGRGELEPVEVEPEGSAAGERSDATRRGGIDLPGFVQRRAREIKRGLRTPIPDSGTAPVPPLRLSAEEIEQALVEARDHWSHLYGHAPSSTVLENAMIWLAHDIWPHSDQSDGRLFTWSAACQVMRDVAPSWTDSPPSFERVMVVAGVLEDPYSASTLALRLPTLIRRFVQRFRRRSRGTSFQTLEHTMTLQGALKLLQLPTHLGQSLTLGQIREAYREMALSHHPDAGGSAEAMRRINEAYQLLKELYRKHSNAQSR
ncbi:J domain-containing protein [Synechococcus sp. CBW1004]|uniref:J domain-containing protein n=1 Tax=Synechococcus sp. CBW1004 TaxID=1353136 RepID=UPI001E5B2585|nr:J domain-containing protein [Synechococcus sp. CBW1004]